DFVGGTSTDVVFNENRSIEELERDVLPKVREATGTNDVTLTPVVGSNEVIIKTPELSQESRSKLYEMLEKDFNVDTSAITYENISGTVSSEMARAAIISVIVASLAMLIYIWIRFRDIRFASSSVLCLVHDVFVVLAGYAVFRWTVGNTFIACMLTLVGYSINATIVVFDRIRENQSLLGHNTDLKEVVNRSITETLGRSVWTSLSTLIMVAVLYILGVTAIKDFALPLMVGIVVGCYSSVCLAGSLWYIFKTKIGSKKKAVQKTAK
ncbi:MAG: protein translocase subunit SecF, partial [Lachnospiraceae bacterium]|nr:protein translocase subunit SecF [Lachnospiraceae bacterium]